MRCNKGDYMDHKTSFYINTLAHFCGKRDLKSLTQTDLMSAFNIPKADILLLFGGSILAGGDLLAKSFVCLLRKERRCGENPARLDEILQRNKKKKMNLRLEPYEKERLLAKAKRSRLW